jgi:hypothetical protein
MSNQENCLKTVNDLCLNENGEAQRFFIAAYQRGYRWNDGKFNTVKAWWIETRDEKAEREFLKGIGCKKPKVIRQTALERYRSFAARADTEADSCQADTR